MNLRDHLSTKQIEGLGRRARIHAAAPTGLIYVQSDPPTGFVTCGDDFDSLRADKPAEGGIRADQDVTSGPNGPLLPQEHSLPEYFSSSILALAHWSDAKINSVP
jgi:hypothetical protein